MMNKKEHEMMITLLTKQYQRTRTIVDILKSRGIISDDDLSPFELSVLQDDAINHTLHQQAIREYLEVGIASGVLVPDSKFF